MAANNLTNTKAELISAMVQKELLENTTLLPLVGDYSSMAVKGVNQVSIPKLSSFAVQSRAFGASASANAPLTDSKDTIDLDQNKLVLWNYDAADALQSSVDYQINAAGRAATAHTRDVNAGIITEMEAVAGLNLAAVADISADNILDMRKFLIQNFADMSKATLTIAADQEKAMLLLPEFSRYDYRGGVAPIISGTIGSVYGVPVVINQAVKAGQAFMSVPEGMGIAFQRDAKFAETEDLSYGSDGKLAVVDQTYGIGGLQLGEGLALDNSTALGATVSPFVAKLIA